MPADIAHETMRGYIDALVARGAFARFFADDVVCVLMGEGIEVKGRNAVEQFIVDFHTKSFDARPDVKSLFVGDGHAALEAVFVGTHTGEFLGILATGRHVSVPYTAVYDLEGDKIAALRLYMPMDVFMRQLGVLPEPVGAAT